MTNTLLISESTLKKYSLIDDNTDGKYILPTIQSTQAVDLDTIIGPVLRSKLESLVASGEIVDEANKDYKYLLDNYVTDYLIYQVMANMQLSLNYKMSNSGVYTNEDERKARLDYRNAQLLQEQYLKNANSFALKLKNYLCKNVQKFPEYRQCENYEYAEEPAYSGIYLGDVFTRKRCCIGR